jgi:hypothetical protein
MPSEKTLLILGSAFIFLEIVLLSLTLYIYINLINTPSPTFPLPQVIVAR